MIRLQFKGYMCNNVYNQKNNEGSYLCMRHMLLAQSHTLRKLAVTSIACSYGLPLNGDSLALCGLCHTR